MDFPESPFPEANAKLEWIDAKYNALQAMAANAQTIQAEIDATTVSVWSPGHEVRVTVGSTGLLRDLEFTARSETLGNQALGRLTLATLKTALLTLAERIAEAADTSADPAIGSAIAGEYRAGLSDSASRLGGGIR
jgi:hypothetical protein